MDELDRRTAKIVAGVAAVVLAAGAAVMLAPDAYNQQIDAIIHDAGASRVEGVLRATDMMSEAVEPGATATTGVMLPEGARASRLTMRDGFELVGETHDDRDGGTWYEVTARNTGAEPARLLAIVQFAALPTPTEPFLDAGDPAVVDAQPTGDH